MIRTGIDLVDVDRLQASVDRFGDRFLLRVFTPAELRICNGRPSSLAARFAAKEAVAKALGTGLWRCGIQWTDIEILNDPVSREPHLYLHRAAAERSREMGVVEWSISLTHTGNSAVAFTVGIG
ncbi:MAG: holo-ACP synthase [Caldilineaceae bacterium]